MNSEALAAVAAAGSPPQLLLPRSLLRALGLATTPSAPVGYVARVWSGVGWGAQTLLGLLVRGWGPGGAGAPVVTATAARYVPATSLHCWEVEALQRVLRASAFRGWVFGLVDAEGALVELTTAPPGGALLGALEGVKGSLGAWQAAPTLLLESWVSSLVLAKWPWPAEGAKASKLPAFSEEVLRHFWPAGGSGGGGLLGWATSWDAHLGKSVARATTTAKALQGGVADLQYRVGAHPDLLSVFATLVGCGLVRR